MLYKKNLERMAAIYGGIAVYSVLPGSPTHRAGVKAGDILMRVNGARVEDLVEYVRARRRRKDGIELEVVRAGRTRTLWADCLHPGEHDADVLGTDLEAARGDDEHVLRYTMRPERPIEA